MKFNEIHKELFEIKSDEDFIKIALLVFKYQYNQFDMFAINLTCLLVFISGQKKFYNKYFTCNFKTRYLISKFDF